MKVGRTRWLLVCLEDIGSLARWSVFRRIGRRGGWSSPGAPTTNGGCRPASRGLALELVTCSQHRLPCRQCAPIACVTARVRSAAAPGPTSVKRVRVLGVSRLAKQALGSSALTTVRCQPQPDPTKEPKPGVVLRVSLFGGRVRHESVHPRADRGMSGCLAACCADMARRSDWPRDDVKRVSGHGGQCCLTCR